jgi:phage terminase large subunit
MLSVQDGIQAARMMLPRTYFDREKCHEGIEALKLYQREWDDDKKVFRDKPLHDWTSHPADAFREMAIAWRESFPSPAPMPPKYPTDLTISELIKRQRDKRLETE